MFGAAPMAWWRRQSNWSRRLVRWVFGIDFLAVRWEAPSPRLEICFGPAFPSILNLTIPSYAYTLNNYLPYISTLNPVCSLLLLVVLPSSLTHRIYIDRSAKCATRTAWIALAPPNCVFSPSQSKYSSMLSNFLSNCSCSHCNPSTLSNTPKQIGSTMSLYSQPIPPLPPSSACWQIVCGLRHQKQLV